MLRAIAAVVFCAAVVGSGVAHGLRTGRWIPLPAMDDYTVRLDQVPTAIGDWTAKDLPLEQDELKTAGIAKAFYRQYRNRRSGEAIGALVVCGRAGPISVHTPDICYRDNGFTPIGEPEDKRVQVGDRLLTTRFLKFRPPSGPSSKELEIRWGWVAGKGQFEAPGNPRLAYSAEPALFKVYLLRGSLAFRKPQQAGAPAGAPDAAPVEDPVVEFMKVFIPKLEAALSGSPQPAA
jgi:hypothetical protein